MAGEIINLQQRKKERTVKWSVVLFAHDDLAQFTRCVAQLVESVGPRAEIVLVAPGALHADIMRQYAARKTFAWREIILNQPLAESDWPLILAQVRGEFLCLLQDAVLVSKNFLTKLTHAYEQFPTEYNLGPVGTVAPISNSAPRRQQLALPPELNAADVDLVQDKMEEQIRARPAEAQWSLAGAVSDACLLIHRTVIEKAGFPALTPLDTVSRGTEWLVRTLTHNFLTILCGNAYVYTSPTMEMADGPRLPGNAPAPKEEKLGICYRVKVETEAQLEYFRASLARSLPLADQIFILDEGSKIKIGGATRELSAITASLPHPCTVKYEKVFQSYDDRRSYNTLLEWAEEAGMTWVLMLETCEVLDPSWTRGEVERLMRPVNPMVQGYILPEYYFWDSVTEWRADGMWNKMNSGRLARVLPSRRIGGFDVLASQNGYLPVLPDEMLRPLRRGLYCFDHVDPTQRAAIATAGSRLAPKLDWSHLEKTEGMKTYPAVSARTLSVYMPANSGGEKLLAWLDHSWSWTDEIVVGNDRCQLSTADLGALAAWGAKVVPCSMGESYAEGRNAVLRACTATHILQLDIDERLDDPLALARILQMEPDAWIFPIANLQRHGKPAVITETARLFRNGPDVAYWGKLHETIDDVMLAGRWKVGASPVGITHFGYLWMTDSSAFGKMQKYVDANIRQMREHPEDGRAPYNLAIHLLEDDFIDDALRLLTIAVTLSQGRVLPMTELAKCHLQKAFHIFTLIARSKQQGFSARPAKEYAGEMAKALKQILPANQIIARGHARGYFETHPADRIWLARYIAAQERKLFLPTEAKHINTPADVLTEAQT